MRSIASDEGPVETMPNMSPSWTSVRDTRLNKSRMRPVLRKSRCRSSTVIRKMRPAASFRGRDGGRMIPPESGAAAPPADCERVRHGRV